MRDDAPRAARGSPPELPARDIRAVLRSGRPLRGNLVVVYVRPGAGPARAAWIVGRRIGTAVARNRARRLIREAWRTIAPRVKSDNDLVIVARHPFEGAKAHDVTHEIRTMLTDAGVTRG